MTVSPNQTQDGSRQAPSLSANRGASDTPNQASELPPTLFQLPNLYQSQKPATSAGQSASSHTGDTSQAVAHANAADSAPTNPPMASQAKPIDSANTETHCNLATDIEDTDIEDTGTEDTDTKDAVASPNLEVASDAPAGRAWMETASSHGLVLVLLIAVVVAAMIVGRRSRNRANQASSTEVDPSNFVPPSELITFGESSEIEPADTAQTDFELTPDTLATLSNPTPEASIASNTMSTASPGNSDSDANLPAPNVSSGTDASVVSTANANVNPNTVNDHDTLTQTKNQYPTASEVIARQGSLESSQAQVVVPEDVSASLGVSTPSVEPSKDAPYLASPTPAGISDWTQYLPVK
ncbi:hypothetical protein CA13_43200 [Planctomycetes bacterium CA13]|uniref:Uncharacterized protein n=1 Tax=Novipirellula herctigrandis TaxID=2527986 RepID=A0A5C5Z716_9BACT|nr:hypothetical protein CA13_43200 [Planctomycetes bacterium CA13]